VNDVYFLSSKRIKRRIIYCSISGDVVFVFLLSLFFLFSFFTRKLSQQLTVQKEDYDRRLHITRPLIGLAYLLRYARPTLRGCMVAILYQLNCAGAVDVAYVSGAETVGAEMSQRREVPIVIYRAILSKIRCKYNRYR